MESREQELRWQITKVLRESEFEFEESPAIGGLRPDFLVRGPEGRFVVVEAKGWKSTGGRTARARDQARKLREATGADQAFVVLYEAKRNYHQWGVLTADGLKSALWDFFRSPPAPQAGREPRVTDPEGRRVFAAMPFDRAYDDTFFVAMSHAAEAVNAICHRVDKDDFEGDVVQEIRHRIQGSVAVIADLSESKANVLYEAGYAHALDKPTVHISSTPLTDLPFDVRNWNTIKYDVGGTSALKSPLARRLKRVLENRGLPIT